MTLTLKIVLLGASLFLVSCGGAPSEQQYLDIASGFWSAGRTDRGDWLNILTAEFEFDTRGKETGGKYPARVRYVLEDITWVKTGQRIEYKKSIGEGYVEITLSKNDFGEWMYSRTYHQLPEVVYTGTAERMEEHPPDSELTREENYDDSHPLP